MAPSPTTGRPAGGDVVANVRPGQRASYPAGAQRPAERAILQVGRWGLAADGDAIRRGGVAVIQFDCSDITRTSSRKAGYSMNDDTACRLHRAEEIP